MQKETKKTRKNERLRPFFRPAPPQVLHDHIIAGLLFAVHDYL
jgi:hypothetical protein